MADSPAPIRRTARDQRREAILATAHDVFFEHGFEGSSMSQISAALGGSKGTLYSYFDSKEALFEALVVESCAHNGTFTFDAPTELSPVEQLTYIARAYIGVVMSEWSIRMLQILAVESRRRSEIGQVFFSSGPAVGVARLQQRFDDLVTMGVLDVDDTRIAAETFMTLCRGILHLRRVLGLEVSPSADVIDREADRAVTQFMKIYSRGPATGSD